MILYRLGKEREALEAGQCAAGLLRGIGQAWRGTRGFQRGWLKETAGQGTEGWSLTLTCEVVLTLRKSSAVGFISGQQGKAQKRA